MNHWSISVSHVHCWIGGLNRSQKYERQLQCVFPIYGKKKNMFQAANQAWFVGKLVINPEIIISVKGTWTLGIWVFTLW